MHRSPLRDPTLRSVSSGSGPGSLSPLRVIRLRSGISQSASCHQAPVRDLSVRSVSSRSGPGSQSAPCSPAPLRDLSVCSMFSHSGPGSLSPLRVLPLRSGTC
ncbi:hypothetical protein chiPu_0017095 [Chiloscyllium punctatum]|uniref:Uncharacterized protein n=1 Tax=Chiloscyllium punctatum TaxID=137246 RepID=A0A401T7G0_CHIPU|nr:hypothetical protein [Chiloscyllium punctatum]